MKTKIQNLEIITNPIGGDKETINVVVNTQILLENGIVKFISEWQDDEGRDLSSLFGKYQVQLPMFTPEFDAALKEFQKQCEINFDLQLQEMAIDINSVTHE